MVPIKRYKEPSNFDKDVRQKGLAFLAKKRIQLHVAAPEKTFFYPYWRACKTNLYKLYNGYCAYTCLHLHEVTGASTVEHIKPKRLYPDLAYEWDNYCLACACINAKKREQTNLLDPFSVTQDLFFLKLETGYIFANNQSPLFHSANDTITCLDLNNQKWCKARQKCMLNYIENRNNGLSLSCAEKRLKESSIFVWSEAKRQKLLK